MRQYSLLVCSSVAVCASIALGQDNNGVGSDAVDPSALDRVRHLFVGTGINLPPTQGAARFDAVQIVALIGEDDEEVAVVDVRRVFPLMEATRGSRSIVLVRANGDQLAMLDVPIDMVVRVAGGRMHFGGLLPVPLKDYGDAEQLGRIQFDHILAYDDIASYAQLAVYNLLEVIARDGAGRLADIGIDKLLEGYANKYEFGHLLNDSVVKLWADNPRRAIEILSECVRDTDVRVHSTSSVQLLRTPYFVYWECTVEVAQHLCEQDEGQAGSLRVLEFLVTNNYHLQDIDRVGTILFVRSTAVEPQIDTAEP